MALEALATPRSNCVLTSSTSDDWARKKVKSHVKTRMHVLSRPLKAEPAPPVVS